MDVVRTHPAMDPDRLVVRLDGAGDLAAALQVGPRAPRTCVERLLDPRLGPSVAREDRDVLRREHHEGFARAEAAESGHRVRDRDDDRIGGEAAVTARAVW